VSAFGKEIASVMTKSLERADRKVKSALISMARDVINETPVDSGRLKNNWYASNRKYGTRTTKQTDVTGRTSLERVKAAVRRLKRGQKFYMFNNLPYSRIVEYGLYPNPPKNPTGKTINGFSTQAPQGMIRKNFNLVQLAMLTKRVK